MKNETYLETTIESWSQINELDDYFFSPFVFRGQSDSTWNLKSSIERKSRDFGRTSAVTGFNTEEKWMLHEFMRKYHLYSTINIDKIASLNGLRLCSIMVLLLDCWILLSQYILLPILQ